jgi:tripartite-type tricarboxylate transporter receptor subunit TctC
MQTGRIASGMAMLALAALTAVGAGAETDYPTRAVKVITPLAPSAAAEGMFRVIAEKLQSKWGQPVVMEFRPGASHSIAAAAVAKAEPDGYTLLFTSPAPVATSKWIYQSLPYDPDAFTPVAVAFQSSPVLTIGPTVPASTLAEFIAYAKANPGKLTFASGAVTTTPYLTTEVLLRRAGLSMVHVSYMALGQGQIDLMAGNIDMMLDTGSTRAIEAHMAGKLKVLAVGSRARDPRLPDVPAISEVLPGYEAVDWYGVLAPPKTPAAIAEKLAREIAEILRMPDVAKRLAQLAFTPVGSTPAETAARIGKESDYWRQFIDSIGMTKSK